MLRAVRGLVVLLSGLPAECAVTIREEHSSEVRGNPRCWHGFFSYDVCCATEESGKLNACWNMHYNYQMCCITPFKPSEQCLAAQGADDLLWHCRVRPHAEFNRCLVASNEEGPMGTVAWFHGSYSSYVDAQGEKASRELDGRFVSERALDVVAAYIRRHFRKAVFDNGDFRGLCHGAKRGAEVRLLRQRLDSGAEIYGTDISKEAVAASMGDVMELDFHTVYMDWGSKWDFIYSNSLDHSYHPGSALVAWRWSLRGPSGLLLLQRSVFHDEMNIDAVDVFGASVGDYCELLRAARFEVIDVLRLPEGQPDASGERQHEEDLIIAVRGKLPSRTEVDQANGPDDAFVSAADDFKIEDVA